MSFTLFTKEGYHYKILWRDSLAIQLPLALMEEDVQIVALWNSSYSLAFPVMLLILANNEFVIVYFSLPFFIWHHPASFVWVFLIHLVSFNCVGFVWQPHCLSSCFTKAKIHISEVLYAHTASYWLLLPF